MRTAWPILTVASLLPFAAPPAPAAEPSYRIERAVILTGPEQYYFSQARGTTLPDGRILLTTQEIEKAGSHGYRQIFHVESSDGGKTWSTPQPIKTLARRKISTDGLDERVIGDVCPRYHAQTGVVLGTGKTFTFRGGAKEDRSAEQVSYAVYEPKSGAWSGLKIVEMPATDHEGKPILQPNSGCNDRVDLPGGEILLPIRYCKEPKKLNYTTIVARCRFDGTTLQYVEHGTELSRPLNRGLYEPSLVRFGKQFLLTLRADDSAFVARSADGLHFAPPIEWKFDDGSVLGSYNTQQHWAAHGDELYLVYTRRGADNDHIFRHRAPLFIAQVDPERLCVLKSTEQTLLPANDADIGNFDVVPVSETETWIVAAEMLGTGKRKAERNSVLAAKIRWDR